ncbi:MAG: ComF family protein [Candidatus Magasanikbacteria bacterium]|nr:ComF family protein [Candidatus Magasanikbacteria bacterium]
MIGGAARLCKIFLAISRDLLFPVFCISCRVEGHWLCPPCLVKLQSEIKQQVFQHPYLDKVFALADYKNEIIARLIHLLKYEYVEEIGEIFEKMIEEFVRQNGAAILDGRQIAIIPIPLHKKRYLERGFNQAELLAKSCGRCLNVPVLSKALIRSRQTKTQVGLSGAERRNNLQGAFALRQSLIDIERVILVDDVFTTGSTMEEVARVLRSAGIHEVLGVTVARET